MTNAEALAAAFPLHYQRICELTHNIASSRGFDGFLDYLLAEECILGPGDTLAAAFSWAKSPEGYDYWEALCDGVAMQEPCQPTADPDHENVI